MAIVLTSWVVTSIQWNCLYKTRGKYLLSGRLWQIMVPKQCTEATWGCQSEVSEVLCDISNFQRKRSDICRTPSELLAQGSHCWQILLTFLLMTSSQWSRGLGSYFDQKQIPTKSVWNGNWLVESSLELKVGGVMHCPTGTRVPLVSTRDYLKTI